MYTDSDLKFSSAIYAASHRSPCTFLYTDFKSRTIFLIKLHELLIHEGDIYARNQNLNHRHTLDQSVWQWRNPHWSIPVNEQVALWTEQVALPSEGLNILCNNIYRNINTNYNACLEINL